MVSGMPGCPLSEPMTQQPVMPLVSVQTICLNNILILVFQLNDFLFKFELYRHRVKTFLLNAAQWMWISASPVSTIGIKRFFLILFLVILTYIFRICMEGKIMITM